MALIRLRFSWSLRIIFGYVRAKLPPSRACTHCCVTLLFILFTLCCNLQEKFKNGFRQLFRRCPCHVICGRQSDNGFTMYMRADAVHSRRVASNSRAHKTIEARLKWPVDQHRSPASDTTLSGQWTRTGQGRITTFVQA